VLSAPQSIEILELQAGQEIIERKVLLQGKLSEQNWLYADSVIVLNRLDKVFQEKLLDFHIPIGKLWTEYKIETYKEFITARREPAEKLGTYFQITPEEFLLSRTYRVFYRGTPTMMITEKFPERYFKN
jgi:chorismate-pyruvate lyase